MAKLFFWHLINQFISFYQAKARLKKHDFSWDTYNFLHILLQISSNQRCSIKKGVLQKKFFCFLIYLYEHSRFPGHEGKGEGISLTPFYHFHPLHGHLHIIRMITAESSPLHMANRQTRTGNLWFPSTSCLPLS